MIQLNDVTYTYPNETAAHAGRFLGVNPARRVRAGRGTVGRREVHLSPQPERAGPAFLRRALGRPRRGIRPRSGRAGAARGMADLVGFVFQDPEAQFVVDTVEDELAFAMENFALTPATMRKHVEEVLDQMGIAHLRSRRISTLSGGEKRRVALASVLALQPEVLVLE